MGSGKVEILASGAPTTNNYTLRNVNILGYGETSIFFQNTGTGGSGVGALILAYPSYEDLLGSSYIILVSGDVIESGKVTLYTVSDAYEALDVGYKSAGTNFSGRVTIVASRKRRQ